MSYNPRNAIEIEKRFPTGIAGDEGKALVVNATGDGYEHAVQAGGRQTGEVIMWPFATAPAGGWLKMDGSTYDDVDYPALATLFGSLGTFTLPNMSERFPMGASVDHPVLDEVDATVGTHAHVAETGGEHDHTGTAASAGLHGHSVSIGDGGAHTHSSSAHRIYTGGSSLAASGSKGVASADIDSAGDHSHSGSAGSAGAHVHAVTIESGGSHGHTVSTHEGINRPACVAFDFYIKT